MALNRRQFVVRTAGAALGGPALLALVGARVVEAGVPPAAAGASPYGPLASTPDENGLLLPAGFTSRVVAAAGEPVGSTSFIWPPLPDGAGIVPTDDGGWCYACNSNIFALGAAGSVSGIRFTPAGEVADAYIVLNGSSSNSGGCATPWGTWLSVEKDVLYDQGQVWECDPTGELLARRLPALGRFSHHSVAVDPVEGRVYLTQAHPLGLLYRFTPAQAGDLTDGVLEACTIGADGSVTWAPVADPLGTDVRTREQVPGATVFAQGGGAWVNGDWLYVATELDHSVHGIDLRAQRYRRVWQGDPGGALSNCDAMSGFAESGDLLVGRNGPAVELVLITAAGVAAPLVRLDGPAHQGSRLTGPVFDPSGTRLYVSSHRATTAKPLGEIVPGLDGADFRGGVTYEITGPFVGAASSALPPVVPTTVPAPVETTAPASSVEPVPSSVAPVPTSAVPVEVPPSTTPAPAPAASSGSFRSFGIGLATGLAVLGVYALFQRFGARRAEATALPTEEASPDAVDTEPDPYVQLTLPFDAVDPVDEPVPPAAEPVAAESPSPVAGRPDIGSRNEGTSTALEFDSLSFDLGASGGGELGFSQAFDLSADDPERLHTPDDYSGSEEELAALAAADEARAAEEAAIARAAQAMAEAATDGGSADADEADEASSNA